MLYLVPEVCQILYVVDLQVGTAARKLRVDPVSRGDSGARDLQIYGSGDRRFQVEVRLACLGPLILLSASPSRRSVSIEVGGPSRSK